MTLDEAIPKLKKIRRYSALDCYDAEVVDVILQEIERMQAIINFQHAKITAYDGLMELYSNKLNELCAIVKKEVDYE